MTSRKSLWSKEIFTLTKSLHSEIVLKESDWHTLKNNKSRRAAELLTSALCQIINDGNQKDIENLIEHSLKWIREEVKDPGCPSR